LRPGNRWFADIFYFIVVRPKKLHKFHFLVFSLPFTFTIVILLGFVNGVRGAFAYHRLSALRSGAANGSGSI